MAITVPVAGTQIITSWGADVTNTLNDLVETANFIPFAYPIGHTGVTAVHSGTSSLTAVSASLGGAAASPFWLPGPIALQSISIWQKSTASLRTAEFRLYRDVGTAEWEFITGTNGTFSFTPTVADERTANIATPGTIIYPGTVWLVIRNTSTSQTFQWGRTANPTEFTGTHTWQANTASVAALGATIDAAATFTTDITAVMGARLNGRVGGETVAF